MKVYVLTVAQGQYSDFGYEILGVFSSLDKAKTFAQSHKDSA